MTAARVAPRLWLYEVVEAGVQRWAIARGTRDAIRAVDEVESGLDDSFRPKLATARRLTERAARRLAFTDEYGVKIRSMWEEALREPVRRHVAISLEAV